MCRGEGKRGRGLSGGCRGWRAMIDWGDVSGLRYAEVGDSRNCG